MEPQEITAPVLPEPREEGSRMKMLKRVLLGLVPVVLLMLFVGVAVALPPRITWTPNPLVTESIAPGESATYTVTFKNTGYLPIPVTNQLRVVPEGDIAKYVTVVPPKFPSVVKPGQSVTFNVAVTVPGDAPVGVSEGRLVLKRVLPNGKVKEVWRAEGLAVLRKDEAGRIFVKDPEGGVYPVNQIELSLIDDATQNDAQQLAELVGGIIIKSFATTNTYYLEVPTLSIEELESTISILEIDARVDYATTNDLLQVTTPNTDLLNLKLYDSQLTKAYDIIAIADSWLMADEELESPPRHVHIGIVDTGIDTSHPEFLGVNLFGDATMEPGSSNSCGFVQSHGTEVAGVIGANNLSATEVLPADSPHMNGIIAGLRDADYALSVYAFSTSDTIQTHIEKGISEGARVFNFSFGSHSCQAPHDNVCSPCLKETYFNKAFTKRKRYWEKLFDSQPNVLFVAAAGNENVEARYHVPGGAISRPNLITVGATELDDEATWANFSNYGEGVDVAAPGVGVYAPGVFREPLDRTDYGRMAYGSVRDFFSGTSAATPMVTGVAAMLMAVSKDELTPRQIKDILVGTTSPACLEIPKLGCRVNALGAMERVLFPPFLLNDGVEIWIESSGVTVLVWDTPSGTVVGSQELGARGTIVGGPEYLKAYGLWMWQVNFDNDPDGWVPETLLRKAGAGVPTGTITVSPNSPCEIPLYGSGCPVTVTWETSNASSPQVKVNGTNQWSTANGVQTISLPVGIHSFGLFEGETGLAEQGGYAVRCQDGLVWDESLQLGDSGKKCLPIAKAQITFGYEGFEPDHTKSCVIPEGGSTCATTVTLDTSPGASEPGLIRVVDNTLIVYADGRDRAGSKNVTEDIIISWGETKFKAVDEKGTGSDILLMASDPLTGDTIKRTAQAYCAAGLVWDANPVAGEVQKCIPMAKSDIHFSYEPSSARDYDAYCEIGVEKYECSMEITATVSGASQAVLYKKHPTDSDYVRMTPRVTDGLDRDASTARSFPSIVIKFGDTKFKIVDNDGTGDDIKLGEEDISTSPPDPAVRTARARCAPGLTFDYAANPQRCRNISGQQ